MDEGAHNGSQTWNEHCIFKWNRHGKMPSCQPDGLRNVSNKPFSRAPESLARAQKAELVTVCFLERGRGSWQHIRQGERSGLLWCVRGARALSQCENWEYTVSVVRSRGDKLRAGTWRQYETKQCNGALFQKEPCIQYKSPVLIKLTGDLYKWNQITDSFCCVRPLSLINTGLVPKHFSLRPKKRN